MEVGKSIAPWRFKSNSKCFPGKYSSLLTNHNKKMDEWKTGFLKPLVCALHVSLWRGGERKLLFSCVSKLCSIQSHSYCKSEHWDCQGEVGCVHALDVQWWWNAVRASGRRAPETSTSNSHRVNPILSPSEEGGWWECPPERITISGKTCTVETYKNVPALNNMAKPVALTVESVSLLFWLRPK